MGFFPAATGRLESHRQALECLQLTVLFVIVRIARGVAEKLAQHPM